MKIFSLKQKRGDKTKKSFLPFYISFCVLLSFLSCSYLNSATILIDAAAVSASQSSAVASKETETVSSETEENINALYTPASASGLSVPSTFKEPAVYAKYAVLMDSATGQVLYKKSANDKAFPASITKIMTLLLAAENSQETDIITMSHTAVDVIKSDEASIALQPGEQITMEQALGAVALASANDAANGVAEKIGGTIADFAKMMTERAKKIGAVNTQFTNANGLHDENHYTTAYDMALITREALKNATFKKYFSMIEYTMQPNNLQKESRKFITHHKMLYNTKYRYKYAFAGKTGYTDAAGSTLVTVASKDGRELICVSLKESAVDAYADAKTLFEYGFSQFEPVVLSSASYEKTSLLVTQNSKRIGTAAYQSLQDQTIWVPKGSGCTLTMIEMNKTDLDVTDSNGAGDASLADTILQVRIPQLKTPFYEPSAAISLQAKIIIDPTPTPSPTPTLSPMESITKGGTLSIVFKCLAGVVILLVLAYLLYVLMMMIKVGWFRKKWKKWRKSRRNRNVPLFDRREPAHQEHAVKKVRKTKIKKIRTPAAAKHAAPRADAAETPVIRKIKTPRI